MENKNLEINDKQEFIKEFDDLFQTKLNNDVQITPLLINIFHNYLSQEFQTSKLYESIISKLVSIEEELVISFTKNQKILFEKLECCRDELINYISEQSFIYGFCMDKELKIERTNLIAKQ